MSDFLQPMSVLTGFLLALLVAAALALLLFSAGRPMLRRMAEWLLHRRGYEKLGIPIRVRPAHTAYERWLSAARETIPVHDCLYVQDVRTIDLRPWEQEGAGIRGLYLRLADYQITDARILEMPAAGKTKTRRHMYEIVFYVVGGVGQVEIAVQNGTRSQITWRAGDVFSIPVNASYQLQNDVAEPARLLAVSSFPFVLNTTGSEQFINNNPFSFAERSATGSQSKSMPETRKVIEAGPGAVLNARAEPLRDHSARGKGVRAQYWKLAGNTTIDINLSEMPAQSIKRAHRANSDATVLMLSGEGYAVTWPDGAWHRRVVIEWGEGTLMAQPLFWYRQFLNLGDVPARNLTASARSLVENLGLRFLDQRENDLPGIRRLWNRALRSERRRKARSGSVSVDDSG